jgi:hypothetical protein
MMAKYILAENLSHQEVMTLIKFPAPWPHDPDLVISGYPNMIVHTPDDVIIYLMGDHPEEGYAVTCLTEIEVEND